MDLLREYMLAYDDLLGEFDPVAGDPDDLDDVMEYLAELALVTPQADGVMAQQAFGLWVLARLFTYVSAPHVRSANPGYCFKMAGWRKVGDGKDGKVVLEKVAVPWMWLFPKGSEDERTG